MFLAHVFGAPGIYSPVRAAEGEQILLELGKHIIILVVRPQQV